jgi:hypothetical protein
MIWLDDTHVDCEKKEMFLFEWFIKVENVLMKKK